MNRIFEDCIFYPDDDIDDDKYIHMSFKDMTCYDVLKDVIPESIDVNITMEMLYTVIRYLDNYLMRGYYDIYCDKYIVQHIQLFFNDIKNYYMDLLIPFINKCFPTKQYMSNTPTMYFLKYNIIQQEDMDINKSTNNKTCQKKKKDVFARKYPVTNPLHNSMRYMHLFTTTYEVSTFNIMSHIKTLKIHHVPVNKFTSYYTIFDTIRVLLYGDLMTFMQYNCINNIVKTEPESKLKEMPQSHIDISTFITDAITLNCKNNVMI
jgi:hypothetical protein